MYTLIWILILIIAAITIRVLYVIFKDRINFFVTGIDAGFSFADLNMLWNVAAICELKDPPSLFYSMDSLSQCMTRLTGLASEEDKTEGSKTQKLLTKLFDYRTKLQNISDQKKGIYSTRDLDKGQKVRVVFPNRGVFSSKILSNSNGLIISIPKKDNVITIAAEEWVGNAISVYFWRKGDARYVFDTNVLQSTLFVGEPALLIKHSTNLIRTQKRKHVRAKCKILGTLFIKDKGEVDYTAIETRNGYKCLIEDVSEAGALIRIGGKGIPNINIKIQYSINNKLIVMYGIIRTVEFNQEKNQSLLHFECTNIEPQMKNEILSFVYNTVPTVDQEAFEAINQTDLDTEETENSEDEENGEKEEELVSPEVLEASLASSVTDNPELTQRDYSKDNFEIHMPEILKTEDDKKLEEIVGNS